MEVVPRQNEGGSLAPQGRADRPEDPGRARALIRAGDRAPIEAGGTIRERMGWGRVALCMLIATSAGKRICGAQVQQVIRND